MTIKEINWEEFKARCSAINKIMSNSRSNPVLTENQAKRLVELREKQQSTGSLTEKQMIELSELEVKEKNSSKVILSDTCIEYLMEEYAWRIAGKKCVSKEMDIEFTQKGRLVEEDSITMISRVDKMLYEKNTERVSNDFLSGEPDIFIGPIIMQAKKIIDIKSLWDYPGFLKKINSPLENGHADQLGGYGDITGATDLSVAYCLANTPETIINDYKRRLFYRMNVATDEAPEYKRACEEMEKSMRFDDIPIEKRVHKIKVEPFTKERQQAIYDRVKVCREWLQIFDENYRGIAKGSSI